MPRYHFDSVDGRRDPDPDGLDLPNDHAARSMAVRYAGEVLTSDPDVVWRKGQWRVEVMNDDGVLLFTLLTVAIDAPRPYPRPASGDDE